MFHKAFHPANICEEQTVPPQSIQKSLTFLGYFFYAVTSSGAAARTADDPDVESGGAAV